MLPFFYWHSETSALFLLGGQDFSETIYQFCASEASSSILRWWWKAASNHAAKDHGWELMKMQSIPGRMSRMREAGELSKTSCHWACILLLTLAPITIQNLAFAPHGDFFVLIFLSVGTIIGRAPAFFGKKKNFLWCDAIFNFCFWYKMYTIGKSSILFKVVTRSYRFYCY